MRSIRPLLAILAYVITFGSAEAASFAYVPVNSEKGVVEVVNITNRTWIKSIVIGRYAYTTVVHPNGERVYVGAADAEGVPVISVINTARNSMFKTITTVTAIPTELVIRPGDKKVLFSSHARGVDMVDIDETGAQPYSVKLISTLYAGQGMGITADGQYLVVAGSKTTGGDLWGVSLVNAQTGTSISDLNLPKDATGVAVNNEFVYVTNRIGNTVSVLEITGYEAPDTASLRKVGDPIALGPGDGPYDLVVDRTNGRLIVSNSGAPNVQAEPKDSNEGSLALINLSTRAVSYVPVSTEGTVSYGTPIVHPQAISLSKDGKTLYVAKQLWAQGGGTYVSTYRVTASGLRDEASTGNINSKNTYNMGDFVGPECPSCPLIGDVELTNARSQPGAVGPFEIIALGALGGAALVRRRPGLRPR